MLDKFFDKFFENKCKSGKDTGPGLLCGIYIIWAILSFIYSVFVAHTSPPLLNRLGILRKNIILYTVFNALQLIFSIVFLYKMCSRCRGFVGFLIMACFTIIMFFIRLTIFHTFYLSKLGEPDNEPDNEAVSQTIQPGDDPRGNVIPLADID
jgi:hypothetical protein